MNEFKGTPGPWTGEKVVNICGAYEAGLSIGYLTTNNADRRAEGEANARLIVAAPDLLEALKHMVQCHYPDANGQIGAKEECWASIQNAQAAIAKALGEQQ